MSPRRLPLSRARVALAAAAGLVAAGAVQPARGAIAAGTFGPNLRLPVNATAAADTEPSIRVAPDGTVYVGAIQGLPSGADLWRSDTNGASFTYLGQPDTVVPGVQGVALGGGDEDFDIVNDGTVGVVSLSVASVTAAQSKDRGASWIDQPLGAIPIDDRPWLTSDGQTFSMSYENLATNNIQVMRSSGANEGLIYTPASLGVLPQGDPGIGNNEIGNIVADRLHPGTLYQVLVEPAASSGTPLNLGLLGAGGPALNRVVMAVSGDGGSTWSLHTVYTGPTGTNYASNFPVVALDNAGNAYVTVSDEKSVLVFDSTDQGAHWSAPVTVSSGGGATIYPWISAGGNGGVVVAWMSASTPDASSTANTWKVVAAESLDGTSSSPSYAPFTISDHVVHKGPLCAGGTSCSTGRELGDFFEVAVGNDGIANAAWADDGAGGPAVIEYARGGENLGAPN